MSLTPVKPVSAAFYVGSYFGGMVAAVITIILGAVGLGAGQSMTENGHSSANLLIGVGIGLMLIGFVLIIYAMVVMFRLYYEPLAKPRETVLSQ